MWREVSESNKEKNEIRKKVEKPVLAWSDVLLIIHYSTFIIYTFHTQQGGSPDLPHKEGVCVCLFTILGMRPMKKNKI